jgi:RNA polymerase sigma factor for flagellar operon FliA
MTRSKHGINAYKQVAEVSINVNKVDKEALFEQYKRRIYQLAHRMMSKLPSNHPLEFEDMVSYGAMGLLEAVDRFDEDRGIKFSTFVDYRIRGAMWDAVRSLDDMSRYSRDQAKQIEQTRQLLEDNLGRAPTAEEMAQEIGIDVEEFFVLEGKLQSVQTVSLDFEDGEGRRPFLEALADENDLDAEDLMMEDDFRNQVRQAIQGLSDKKRDCILLYYGRNLNLSEIAEVFDVTPSRVSQILSGARADLRETLKEIATLYGFVQE